MTKYQREPVSTLSDAGNTELLSELFAPLARLLTSAGITGDEIKVALHKALENAQSQTVELTPVHLGAHQRDCMEVLCLWRRHPEFLDARGCSAAIPLHGQDGSFESLCRRAGVTTDASVVLETLKDFGAVELTTEGLALPMTATFLLGATSGGVACDGMLKQLAGFVRVIEHNLLGTRAGRIPRFERACSVVVAVELLPIVQRLVRERGQEFIDTIDEWLERNSNVPSASNCFVEVGAGAYFVHLGKSLGS